MHTRLIPATWRSPRLLLIALAAGVTAHAAIASPGVELLTTSTSASSPPRLLRAVPDNADLIDPALTQLRFEFDQPMSTRGFSICGGGQTFPQVVDQARWESDRVLVVPVRLAPHHDYQMSLNCPGAQNLRSAGGEPLEAYPIRFRTLEADEPAPTLDPGQARRSLDALRTAIDNHYSYRDLRGVDWDAAFDAATPDALAADTPAALARALARLLAAAGDVHISLGVNGMRLGTIQPDVTPNFDVRLIGPAVPNLRQATRRVAVGRWDDGPAYVLIGGWDAANRDEDLPAILDAIDQLSNAPGLILDVRINAGGSEEFAQAVASRLASHQSVYARSMVRDPDHPSGFAGPFERSIAPDPSRPDDFVPPPRIAVLIGPTCISSNESFIRMMTRACDARTFGARTYGSSGNPREHDLGAGITVLLPSWQDIDADGTPLEGKGIEPDEPVEWRNDGSDPVLRAALDWVRGGT